MIWTVVKADLLWSLITLPLLVGINVLAAYIKSRQTKRANLSAPAWARRPQTPGQKWKNAVMRRRQPPRLPRGRLGLWTMPRTSTARAAGIGGR